MRVTFVVQNVEFQFETPAANRLGQVADLLDRFARTIDQEIRDSATPLAPRPLVTNELMQMADIVRLNGKHIKHRYSSAVRLHLLNWSEHHQCYYTIELVN